MTNPHQGVPCRIDLWTSDPEAARRFYTELFGWTVDDPNPEFGGYFNFRRNGEWIAGGMGDMGDPNGDTDEFRYTTLNGPSE